MYPRARRRTAAQPRLPQILRLSQLPQLPQLFQLLQVLRLLSQRLLSMRGCIGHSGGMSRRLESDKPNFRILIPCFRLHQDCLYPVRRDSPRMWGDAPKCDRRHQTPQPTHPAYPSIRLRLVYHLSFPWTPFTAADRHSLQLTCF